MKMNKFVSILTFAFAVSAAQFAMAGDIYEIRPCDAEGRSIPAKEPGEEGYYLTSGDTAFFKVRVAARVEGGRQFRMHYTGIDTADEYVKNWYAKRPAIGVFVNGKRQLAYYVTENKLADGVFTDFIFSYYVNPGDLALPIRLSDKDGKLISGDQEGPVVPYYLNFRDTTLLDTPIWEIDDSDGVVPASYTAEFTYGTPGYPVTQPELERLRDYNLSKCNFYVKAVDFDAADPDDAADWRVVYQDGNVSNSVPARLVIDGIPTNSVTLYLWSEDENAFYVQKDKAGNPSKEQDITVAYGQPKEKRHVLAIRTIPGRGGEEYPYEFELKGVTKGKSANLVLSAFPDFNYGDVGFGEPTRVNDYLSVRVSVCDPRPPSVSVEVGKPSVIATADPNVEVTELKIAFSQPYPAGRPVTFRVVPKFTDESGKEDHEWYDYLRFAVGRGKEVTLQTPDEYKKYPTLVIDPAKNATKPTSLNGTPLEDPGVVYVYALYSDKFSSGALGKFTFGLETDDAEAANPASEGGIDGWNCPPQNTPRNCSLVVKAEDPVLTTEKTSVQATVKVARSFELGVTDLWGNLHSTTNYELYYQSVDEGIDPEEDDWVQIAGEWKFDPVSGFLKNAAGKSPTVVYDLTGKNDTYFYVKAPNGSVSGKGKDDALLVKVTVKAADTVSAKIAKVPDAEVWTTSGRFDEGTTIYVQVSLDGSRTKDTIYAFLAPVGDAVNCVSGDAVTNSAYTEGIEIEQNTDASVTPGSFVITDGTAAGKQLKFDILLCKTQQWDPAQKVEGYQSKTLTVTAMNVIPTINAVKMDAAKVEASEETMHTGKGKTEKTAYVPLGMKKTFKFDIDEPGEPDKTATGEVGGKVQDFAIDYTIVEANGATDAGTIYGNPDVTNLTYTFTGAGTAEVTLQLKDKDMAKAGEEFIFYVEVTAQPSVVIEGPGTIDETMVSRETAPFNLSFSDFGTEALTAKVTVAYNETVEKDRTKIGFVRLGGAINDVPYLDEKGNEYYLVVMAGGKATLFVAESDGLSQNSSLRKGYTVTAEIVDSRENPVSKTSYSSYYLSSSTQLFIDNVAPKLLDCNLGSPIQETGSYTNTDYGIGQQISVEYKVDDIFPDLTNLTGVTAKWLGGSNSGATTNIYDNTNTYYYTTKFTASGLQKISVELKDKDGNPPYKAEWWFLIESTKTLITVPNGPSGMSTTLSQRYAGQPGSGEGHVWSDMTFSSADNFVISWNCSPSLMSANVYGWGYKTNAVDNGMLDSEERFQHDVPLSPKGNNTTESGKTDLGSHYAYTDARDSFLYGWISHSTGDNGGGSGGGSSGGLTSTFKSLAPERPQNGATPYPAMLPNPNSNNNNNNAATVVYPITYAEAVFSKELLPSDNMGDINADGIPDHYLLLVDYEFGIVDPTTGELAGNDLRDLNFTEGENPEPYCVDYLPTMDSAAYASFIPGLSGTWVDAGLPFIPRLKIRGFDEDDLASVAKRGTSVSALNDAPEKWAGIRGVKPDRIYTNPREDAASTLNYVEWLAWSEYKTANPTATENDWSPERPTIPTRSDTDGDGLTDGFEYYVWYNAHVGYLDENGVHKYLTGRRYDERNPGEGTLITSEEIALAFDPRNPTGSKMRDFDNDGLPDLLEFEIGTNPFDFDTDGDGLPDGWELTIAGLNPLLPGTSADALMDGERNYDGDAMAITSWKLEENVKPRDLDVDRIRLWTFATIDPNGDTDGVQWYATKTEPAVNVTTNAEAVWSFKSGDRYYVSFEQPFATADGRLANTLKKGVLNAKGAGAGAFVATKPDRVITPIEEPEPDGPTEATNYVAGALYPVRLEAGLPISDISGEKVDLAVTTIKTAIKEKDANACWIYGKNPKGSVNALAGEVAETAADYGCLALGRQLGAAKDAVVCALPSHDRDVAFLHYLVYQEFGFDPRTAWKAKDPLANRWSKTIDGEAVEGITVLKQGGYTGAPARTRDYATYDEFLVYSFFLNSGCDMEGVTYIMGSKALAVVKAWGAFTTNPQGPNEPDAIHLEAEGAADYYFGTKNGENGADTDGDGVPDGWELYVMAGPKYEGAYVFAPPYAGFVSGLAHDAHGEYKMEKNFFSPFVDAAKTTDTSNQIYLGGQINDDGLNEFKEFESTDAMNYYADYSTTVVHEDEWKWLNKFFPTDPWSKDTDGDGIDDKTEGSSFVYGTPADDGKLWSIPGGGLNPCSVDTDLDGLPDPWEKQYAGKPESLYAGDLASFAKDADGNPIGNALQGLTDGMDGTVKDAFTYPITYKGNASGGTNVTTYVVVEGVNQVVNRDYDRDGLENWQEYLTGTMRCWRYDDPLSPWTSIPDDWYWSENPVTGEKSWNPQYEKFGLEEGDEDGFWYMTLVDTWSEYYNPHLITGQNNGSQYFSRVTNTWDCAYSDALLGKGPTYYHFYNRLNGEKFSDSWIKNGPLSELLGDLGQLASGPSRYVGCSPIDPDSDHDGMDDYYELFHGMNPLLGKEGQPLDYGGPCDLVYDAWYLDGTGAPSALAKDKERNYWHRHPWKTPRAGEKAGSDDLDFTVFPWLNGRQMSDPDGDDLLNEEEALRGRDSVKSWHHTDPTPLWMTDSSYSDSLVRQFFRMPEGLGEVELPESGTFEHTDEEGNTTVYHFRDFDGFADAELEGRTYQGSPYSFMPFSVDAWSVCGADKMNWICSFEENEGYDSDHDALSDHEELESKFRSGTDPQDADSPRRRQAMYFSGPDHPSALQTMPFVAEEYPLGATTYPTDLSFLRYTVECWVMPESLADATIIERAVYVGESNPGDQEFLRCNFRLAIKDGKWYTKFDPNGTLRGNQVEVFGSGAAKGAWTHLAATYDGEYLRLYVNGAAEVPKKSGLQPAYGSDAVAHQKNNSYWFDHEYDYKAILVGASFRTNAQGVNDGSALDVTEGRGWDRYCGFFKGYVDEIRIWDGARKPEEIKAAKDVRFDAAHAKENRSAFYDSWAQGKYRYADDGSGNDYDVPAELRFHWTFDSVPAAATAREVATSPHGFYNGKAPLSRPDDYGIAWWQTVLAGYVGTVYCDPAWVQWIPNTVTHLPRFDGTPLDSVYWSADFMGETAGEWSFARTAEPVSRWTQMIRNGVSANTQYKSTSTRHQMVNQLGETGVRFYALYDFTGRNLNQTGDDLLPLGGAYVKYLPTKPGVWDGQGASTTWEITGSDGDNDGLPNWWEIYVEQNERKRLGRDVTIDWNTVIDYHGIAMTAGEAYMRDLAKGVYVDANGKIHNDLPTEFAQTADEDFNGIPDWWTQMYGIEGEDGLADHDNDGLPNYVEYLLSEVFDFKLPFSPVKWDSITQGVPDYFHKVGELYVGEIFTDHDLVDDAWEDLYDSKYASRLAWDAFADADQDGWSNRSEVRYSKMVLPIIADQQAHYETSGIEDESDGRIADYPIPTVSLTLSYIGARKDDVSKSPIVVKATRDASLTKEFDAVFTVAGISEEKVDPQSGSTTKSGGSGKDDTNDNVGSLKRYLGKWSDRHAIGTLTPGNIKRESVLFEFAYTPSSAVYEWVVRNDLGEIVAISRGTIDEYRDVLRKYGSRVELTVKDSNYSVFQKVQLRPAVDSTKAIWFLPETGTDFGTLDLKTGAFDVNLGVFKGQYVQNPSNATDVTSLEDMTYRISYWSNMAAELPRQLYLGEAQTGYLREGKNSFVAWADLDGDGEWTVGEPYGMVRDVDVSWRGTVAEIELTDESPITPRIDLVSDAADGRGITHTELTEWIAAHPGLSKPTIIEWLASNPVQQGAVEGASFKGQRIRVVRWLLNDVPVYLSSAPARVVLDKKIETDVRACLTEADFLIGNDTFDIDWNDFYGEVVSDGVVRERIGNVTNASYLVVVGDGDVSWDKAASTNRVYALNTVITRHFGATRVKPVPVAPGAVGEEIVRSANPTFKWTMNCPEEEGYTAFNVQVLDGQTVIYDSDKQLAPPRNIDGQYVWEAPLYVGDKTPKGKVFENKKAYSWKVSMYNAKYSNTAAYSDVGKFFMEVQTNGYEYGSANVAVRYFGPTNTWSKSKAVIRVRAYTSPDFTGLPVAAGYVAEQGSVTDTTVTNANCTVVGIPRGTYYLQAFIDSNENGVCDPWETQGYLCTRDGSTPDYLDPTAITFDSKIGQGDLAVIYLEDADTDGDGLPDAWEYAEYGSLEEKGIELITETKAGEFVVNTNLTGSLALQENAQVPTAGLAGRLAGAGLMSNAGVLALAMGAETEGYDSFAAAIRGYVSPELVEDGVRITSLDLVDGKVSIKVEAETETAGSAWVKGTQELTVLCQVQWKPSLTSSAWTDLGKAVEITVGTEEAAEIPVEMPDADADSGYFSVRVYKK